MPDVRDRVGHIALGMCLAGALVVVTPATRGAEFLASADSATPTVTPTPTAAQVLDRMMSAWQAAGSNHFTIVQREQWTAGTSHADRTFRQVGDVAWQNPPLFEMSGPAPTVKRTGNTLHVQTVKETQIYVGNRLAVKIGKRKWSCNAFYGYSDLPGDPVWDGTSPYGLVGKNLGVTTVNGVAAWHVQWAHTVKGSPDGLKPTQRETRSYYVSVADYRPVEIRFQVKETTAGLTSTETSTMLFSDFGETVNPTLPAACTK